MSRIRGQRGASLILVLALITFLAVLLPAVFGLVMTGSKVTPPVREDRRETYAASSALDAAIELGRHDADIGVPGGACPDQNLSIEGFTVEVEATCPPLTDAGEWCFIDRFASYVATVRDAGNAVVVRSAAEVVYRWESDGWRAEVHQWNPDTGGFPSTTALPACPTGTTAPTTSTTSTTVPTAGSYAVWETSPLEDFDLQGNKWRAEGTVGVTDDDGNALVGVDVTVRVDTRGSATEPWVEDEVLTFPTNDTGRVTFHSASFNNPVKGIQFTITAVAAPGLTWNAAAHPTAASVSRP